MKKYLLTFCEDHADEHDVPATAIMTEDELNVWKKTKLQINAYLGNNSDCFLEDKQGLTGEEFIKNGMVETFIVDESFIKVYKEAKLEYHNLCDIFEGNEYDNYEEDEEDE